ncbi:P-loop containing nucleoside triphosphate hydrolase [Pseudocohnilembus persalinus]|uniref:Kinesin-like protein n=1 Tax=Pseudocohnilembus persalinus TaxID=266149 RepID=A0A0V0QA78_PSEPJ|nr:P-loop containing nucleoside triphosphate hydrolase [Pseudocohnilembus persalinus]|eukprot:KRW99139.1 P-loop containing nucleoside triphosphate hydrolase [Pseudocohnilembus persalinus]
MSKNSESVKVAVRCRPISRKEQEDNRNLIVQVNQKTGEIIVQNPKAEGEQPKTFTFDKTYAPDCKQSEIYDETAYPIVESVLTGYNGTIFAYGQTGTGKTHTMEGNINVPDLRGIIPRTFDHIFKTINGTPGVQFMVRASMFELYNEEIRDLLVKSNKKLEIREHKNGGTYVKDLSSFMIQSAEELMEKLNFGKENRQVGATSMNQDSSRSHSIFSLQVETCVEQDGNQRITQGKLNLVDLAGSERQSKTNATGDRLKEGISINQSLTTLGNVISALVDGKSSHIPYRDSKLTRILSDSLGGNTKTVMIANIGPVDYNYDETVTTLRYAWRAKSIKNKPKINEDPKDAMIRQFQEEITKLKEQLAGSVEGQPHDGGDVEYVDKVIKVTDNEKLQETEKRLEQERQQIKKEFEDQRQKILSQKNVQEEEKKKLLKKLKEKEEAQKIEREKYEKLVKKIKKMEEKVMKGESQYQEALEKERQIKLHEQEIEEKRKRDQQLQDQLKEKELLRNDLTKKYNSYQEENEDKTQKLKQLQERLKVIQTENQEIEDFYVSEIDELQERRRDLLQELKLKQLILEYFVPQQELEQLQLRAVFNDDIDDWMYPNLQLAGNTLRMNRGGKDLAPNQQELDEIEALNLNGHPNVYFAYTEEGPVREEELNPQEKKQKESRKKQQTGKRSKKKEQEEKKPQKNIAKAKGLGFYN